MGQNLRRSLGGLASDLRKPFSEVMPTSNEKGKRCEPRYSCFEPIEHERLLALAFWPVIVALPETCRFLNRSWKSVKT